MSAANPGTGRVPVHDQPCRGLPDGTPCPYKRKGSDDNVVYTVHMMDLCRDCRKVHEAVNSGLPPPGGMASTVTSTATSGASETVRTRGQTAMSSGTPGATAAAAPDTVFDPVLCYVASSRDTSKRSDVSHMVAVFFSVDLIIEAKALLWRQDPGHVLGDLTKRRGTDERSGKQANAQDIYDAMKKLEDLGCLPTFAVRATELHLLPTVKPCELLDFSITERMTQLEAKMSCISESMDFVSNQNSAMKIELSKLQTASGSNGNAIPHIYVTEPTVDQHGMNDLPQSYLQNPSGYSDSVRKCAPMPRPPKPPQNQLTSRHLSDALSRASWPSMTGSVTSLASDDATPQREKDVEFDLPAEQQRRIQRAAKEKQKREDRSSSKRKQKFITGRGEKFGTFTSTAPDKAIYVYRVSKSSTQDDVENFLGNANINVSEIREITDEKWATKSYKVDISAEQFDDAIALEWPRSVRVRPWHYTPRKKNDNKAESDSG